MAECPKCGTEFVPEGKIARCPECRATFANVPVKVKKKPTKPAAKPGPKANGEAKPTKPKPSAEEQPAHDMYGFAEEEDLAEVRRTREEKEVKEKEEKKSVAKPVIEVKRKNIGDLKVWEKIDRSMIWFFWGVVLWGVRHLLHGMILFFGMVGGPDYPRAVAQFLIRPNQPAFELGRGDILDRVSFTLAMLGGSDFVTLSFVLMLLGQILLFAQVGVWMTGIAIAWQGTEPVEAGKPQLISLYALGGFNLLASVLLVLLPLLGAYSYIPMPLWATEMAMCHHNKDRTTPLHIFWSFAPFWDTLLTLLVLTIRYAEPTMIVYFIWTVAARVKDERVDLDKSARMTVQLGCAVTFLLLTFELFSLTGSTPTLVRVLQLLYLLWYLFMILWILRVAGTISKCRDMFRFYFDPDAE